MTARKSPNWIERVSALDPALLRGFIVTAFALGGAIFGVTVDDAFVQNVITFVLALIGLLTAVLIRPSVTPNAKVLAYVADPYARPLDVESGEATVPASQIESVVVAATTEGKV